MTTTATAPATCTYRKTKAGEWVVYGPADVVIKGTFVGVTKKSGEEKYELVTRVGHTFIVDGTEMVYGYMPSKTGPTYIDTAYDRRGLPRI